MKPAPIPSNESDRLRALYEYQLLDSLPEEVYDDITRLATELCGTPIAAITLVDKNRQWFKSKQGIEIPETPREHSFCAHTILNPDEALVVPDARFDERFHDNPLTTGDPNIAFYAGVPIKAAEGLPLGALCVIDNRPRELPEHKIDALKALAKLVQAHFELRKVSIELEKRKNDLENIKGALHEVQNHIATLGKTDLRPEQSSHISAIQDSLISIRNVLE